MSTRWPGESAKKAEQAQGKKRKKKGSETRLMDALLSSLSGGTFARARASAAAHMTRKFSARPSPNLKQTEPAGAHMVELRRHVHIQQQAVRVREVVRLETFAQEGCDAGAGRLAPGRAAGQQGARTVAVLHDDGKTSSRSTINARETKGNVHLAGAFSCLDASTSRSLLRRNCNKSANMYFLSYDCVHSEEGNVKKINTTNISLDLGLGKEARRCVELGRIHIAHGHLAQAHKSVGDGAVVKSEKTTKGEKKKKKRKLTGTRPMRACGSGSLLP